MGYLKYVIDILVIYREWITDFSKKLRDMKNIRSKPKLIWSWKKIIKSTFEVLHLANKKIPYRHLYFESQTRETVQSRTFEVTLFDTNKLVLDI